jgi:glycosyltransferase involved in cell wall biosynthesis
MPLVSVLIPCYNAASWIGETLRSVAEQTWRNIQIVVVDDGSSDSSVEVVRAFEHPNLLLLTQENRGQTAALNRCLTEARGEFIQYLDADDLLHPQKIEIQLQRLVAQPDCIAAAEWGRFYTDPATTQFVPDESWRDMTPVDWLITSWREGGGMLFPAMWLIPRSIVSSAGPWREDLTLNNDAEYFTRVILASAKVLFCKGARAYYRSGIQGSLSGMKSDAGWRSQEKVLECCEQYLLGAEQSERARRAASMLWQRFAYACYPYIPSMANRAVARAKGLHGDSLAVEGGLMFRVMAKLVGWRLARRFQRWYYSRRYGIS